MAYTLVINIPRRPSLPLPTEAVPFSRGCRVLTRGNHKLGTYQIWGFSLPSGTNSTCPGMTPTCGNHCYAVAMARYRPAAANAYRRNLASARRRDFVRRVRAFLLLHDVRVVRVHVGGDFFSARYADRWLRIMRRSPRTRFYFYTRSWRVPAIKAVIDRMSTLANSRVWYSTGSRYRCARGCPISGAGRVADG